MSRVTTYHEGGFDPSHPNENIASVIDSESNTCTTWDAAGKQIESRPLTPSEIAEARRSDQQDSQFANRATITQKAALAIVANAAFLAQPAYPANPTVAERDSAIRAIRQQVNALTRQANALIKLELADLSDTTGT